MIKDVMISFSLFIFLPISLCASQSSSQRTSTESVSSSTSISSKLRTRFQELHDETIKQDEIEALRIEVYQSLNTIFIKNKRQEDRKKRMSFCK